MDASSGASYSLSKDVTLLYGIVCGISLNYTSDRSFTENISFELNANIQPLLIDETATQETETLNITANNAVTGYTSYWATGEGESALEYMMMRARARLLTKARAVNVSFQTSFYNGVDLSCRMGAQISDERLPGGVARGKIISYSLSGNGTTGEFVTDIKIGCSVGSDGSVDVSGGLESYADGYSEGYTVVSGIVKTPTGVDDMAYTPISHPNPDLSIGAISATVTGGNFEGIDISPELNISVPDVANKEVTIDHVVSMGNLVVPKQIDLSA